MPFGTINENIGFFVSKRRSVLSAIKILIISFNDVEKNIGTEERGGGPGRGVVWNQFINFEPV